MNAPRSNRLLVAGIALAMLAACNRPAPPADPAPTAPASGPQTALGRTVDRAMDEARKELATSNLDLNNTVQVRSGGVFIGNSSDDTRPKGEITPQGDFLVDGAPVAIDEAQRRLLLDYRGHVLAVAETGMALGVRGADLGMKAAGEAIRGIFSGNPDQIEKKIKAEAEQIKAESLRICTQLQAVHDGQQALKASLPAFAPYANLSEASVRKCADKTEQDGGMAVFSDDAATGADDAERARIREEIRKEVQAEVRRQAEGSTR